MKYTNIVICFLLLQSALYSAERTQEIKLEKGWNSVYLEVVPQIDEQNISAFLIPTASAIEMIATYYPKSSSVEYISDPSNIGWKKASWIRWIRDDLPESFLSNLYDLEANQGYLVKASSAFVWRVKGEVVYKKKPFQPNSFNLRGFKVKNSSSSASFHNLLQENTSAKGLINSPIYKLLDGSWTKINIVDEPVQENRAYWVYSDNTAEFQGTIKLDISNGASKLNFLDIVRTQTVTLTNTSNNPISVVVSLENNSVPLLLVERDALYNRTYTPVTTTVTTVTLLGNDTKKIKLAVDRNKIEDANEKTGLLKFVVSSTNEVIWVSISAYKGNR